MDDLTRRAVVAYYRTGGEQPRDDLSGPVEHAGRTYVVLRSGYQVLAVYRLKTTGMLKRLKRWPAVIENMPPQAREGSQDRGRG
jgi:hypothetical protein